MVWLWPGRPQLCSEYAAEVFAHLRGREAAPPPGHLQGCPTNERVGHRL